MRAAFALFLIAGILLSGCIWDGPEAPAEVDSQGKLDISAMSYDEIVAMGVPAKCTYSGAGKGWFYQRGTTDFYLPMEGGHAIIISNRSSFVRNPAFGIEGNETSECEWLRLPEDGSAAGSIADAVSGFSDIRCEAVNYSLQKFMPPVWEVLCEVEGGNVTVEGDRKLEGDEGFDDNDYEELVTAEGAVVCEVESMPEFIPGFHVGTNKSTVRFFTDGQGRFRIETRLEKPWAGNCTYPVMIMPGDGKSYTGCLDGQEFTESMFPESEITECRWVSRDGVRNEEFEYLRPGDFRCMEWEPEPAMFVVPAGERVCSNMETMDMIHEFMMGG